VFATGGALTSTGGGGVTGKPAAAALQGNLQLMLMLYLNHSNEQE